MTAEYNHGIPSALKNTIDYLGYEWLYKDPGFASNRSTRGAQTVEQLRLVMGELLIMDVRLQVVPSNALDFEDHSTFRHPESHVKALNAMPEKLIAWGTVLKFL